MSARVGPFGSGFPLARVKNLSLDCLQSLSVEPLSLLGWILLYAHSESTLLQDIIPALSSLPMNVWTPSFLGWFAAARPGGPPGYLVPRWLFLRAIAVVYFSVFYSLAFQIRGLLGPHGLLPANLYLRQVAQFVGASRYWYAPTLLWLSNTDRALMVLCWTGMITSILLLFNLWPRAMLVVCFVLFLSFVSAAQEFSGYQSDGMLLSAGFISFFFAPRGWRPGWGEREPPSRASLFLLQFLWFIIYFDSGIAKYFGGDPSWRDLTAMDQYYQNGPLPTWIGWYAQQLPHWFHAATAACTLLVELVLVWMLFLPRRLRIVCFCVVTTLQIGIMITANYAFLNYLVLALGVLLLDDLLLVSFLPKPWANAVREELGCSQPTREEGLVALELSLSSRDSAAKPLTATGAHQAGDNSLAPSEKPVGIWPLRARRFYAAAGLWLNAVALAWLLYANFYLVVENVFGSIPLPTRPVGLLEPFHIANSYGLFGRMTWKRYEIEFQGSNDGANWVAYPFRNKPQDPAEAPRIYAPYQPRFDWNLWFASLGSWRENPWIVRVEESLLLNDSDVLALFAANPFPKSPPKQVRAVLWQYWCTDRVTKRATGRWWRREFQGLFAPTVERGPDDKFLVVAWPGDLPSPP